MTSKEALNTICLECQKYKGKIQVACPFRSISNDYCDEYEQIKKDLEVLDFFKKLFVNAMPIRLTDLQDQKYLSIPTSDIRRPDALLPITEKEYELLKEWFRSNLLKEWLNDK